jgi:UPF0755 protein
MAADSGGRRPGGILIVAVVLAAVIAASALYAVVYSPVGDGDGAVTVRIEPGMDLRKISELLLEAGAISHTFSFYWGARLAGLDRKLRSGDYELFPSWNLKTLLETLSSGKGIMLSVTFPEGMTLAQMAARLEASGVTDGDAFLGLATSPDYVASLGIPGPTAEGFLFPETYIFASPSTPEAVIDIMYGEFRRVYGSLEGPGEEPDVLETVTLASIIEKETSLPEERPIVSAVFHNRIRTGGRLESDPTVIYGIENFNGNLTRADLERPTPYNTYVIRGLPPGPIANPGRGALWAALNPADVDYYFFVSRNDGSHHFSTTLKEHRTAVRRYQLSGRNK